MTEQNLDDLASEVARSLDGRIAAITDGMTERLAGIGEISPDPKLRELLRASIESNLTTILHMIQNAIPLEQIRLPAAAEAYAERLAQRGVSANSLVRAYHMGQDDLRDYMIEEVEQLDASPEVKLRVVQKITDHFYRYIDKATLAVLEIHQAEQARWNAVAGNVASAMVHRLLAGETPTAGLRASTGLVLAQQHLGLILWSDGGPDRVEPLRYLEAVGRSLASAAGTGAPLFCAVDLVTAWLWLPLGRRAEAVTAAEVDAAVSAVPGVRAAIGLPAFGLSGFRRTHRQALAARELAFSGTDRVVAYGRPGVALVSMLARDTTELRDWVQDVLGPLAVDTEANERQRETLLVFLESGSSTKLASERLHLHRNTVRYRIERITELLGRDPDSIRLDLEVALRCVQYLGKPILSAETDPPEPREEHR